MPKTLTGTVSSVAPNKTIVITVHTRKTHPIYKKQYTVTTKFMAHDENNDCSVGDRVTVVETRPISKRKHYTLQAVLQKAALTVAEKAAIEESAKTDADSEEEQ